MKEKEEIKTKKKILNHLEERIKVVEQREENINKTIIDFEILFKGQEVRVFRTIEYSDMIGEMEDSIEIETRLTDLTDEEEEEIKGFIWEIDD